jgi:GTPase SAR1 family protein
VGKTSLLATWREGRFPATPALSTIYDWVYFNYCLNAKTLLLQQQQQQQEEKERKRQEGEEEQKNEEKKEEEEVREIVIEFLDTAGEYEGFRNLRPWHYKDVDVFILAFDVTNRESFLNVPRFWAEEIKTWTPSCIKVLVGTKADVADDPLVDVEEEEGNCCGEEANKEKKKGRRQVSKDEAEQLAKRIEAVTYVEVRFVEPLHTSIPPPPEADLFFFLCDDRSPR